MTGPAAPTIPTSTQVSDGCSGVEQGSATFATILGAGVSGMSGGAAGSPAAPAASAQPSKAPAVTDDPSTSPYPMWNETTAYTSGERIVWHSNVYEAKWWTRADTPDDPVLQGAATPWRIIGPVLPGDKPTPQLTAPAGTAPEWEPATVYRKGDRVLFEGRVYEAKWWTQTDSPEAAQQGAPESPWAKLRDEELLKLMTTASATPTPSP